MKRTQTTKKKIQLSLFILGAGLCIIPFVQPPIALLAGFFLTLMIGNPFLKLQKKVTKYLLQASVVGLGFGMNMHEAFEVGKSGLIFTVISISLTIGIGLLLGKLFATPKRTSILVSTGTAICGGSAIAAMAPIIEAREDETSVSLGIIFLLNSIALLIFPILGELFQMTQGQFGLWSAIAIHDTSSVVGAAHKYGEEALKIATTVKLERALWIIPVSLITSLLMKTSKRKISIPYFIFLYVVAIIINSVVPAFETIGPHIAYIAKRCLVVTLFLIGAGLTKEALKTIGIKPLIQGVLLWIFISVFSLAVILMV